MCPSYMGTLDEAHSTRGRANVLRLAMSGQLGHSGLASEEVLEVLDLCLECRACKSECPVGVDVARFKSEFLAQYWSKHGTPLRAMLMGNIGQFSAWVSRFPGLANWISRLGPVRIVNQLILGIDKRRLLPPWRSPTFANCFPEQNHIHGNSVLLFNDTFTNYFEPEIGLAAVRVLNKSGFRVQLQPYSCCGRTLISQGLLRQARHNAQVLTRVFYPFAATGKKILFCEPSCLSAVQEDNPSLLRGQEQEQAQVLANSCMLFEDFLERHLRADSAALPISAGPSKIIFHGHCHQKAMGLDGTAKALLSRIPNAVLVDADAGCCGMAGSFGYMRNHYELSRTIGERKLFPICRQATSDSVVVVAAGTSCRHQVEHFTGAVPLHPAVVFDRLLHHANKWT